MILLGSLVYLLSTYSKLSSSTLNYPIKNFRWYFLRFHWRVSMILSEEINENWNQYWEQGYLELSCASFSLCIPCCPKSKGHLEPKLRTQGLTPMACPSVSLPHVPSPCPIPTPVLFFFWGFQLFCVQQDMEQEWMLNLVPSVIQEKEGALIVIIASN